MAIDPSDRVILIRIARLYRPGMGPSELYEATRKWWVLNPDRHRADWAFALADRKVRGVYRIDDWERSGDRRRWAFRGRRDEEMERKYVGMDVTGHFPRGAQNPIRYVNC